MDGLPNTGTKFGSYQGKNLVYLLLCNSVGVFVNGVAEIARLNSIQERRAEVIQDEKVDA